MAGDAEVAVCEAFQREGSGRRRRRRRIGTGWLLGDGHFGTRRFALEMQKTGLIYVFNTLHIYGRGVQVLDRQYSVSEEELKVDILCNEIDPWHRFGTAYVIFS